MSKTDSQHELSAKQAVGRAAADLVQDGMIVGIGTGSTAKEFTLALGARIKQGLRIQGVTTSSQTRELAHALSIPLLNDLTFTSIDLTVDGADEVDPKKRIIKGGGGALLHEKIVASASKELIIIIDEAKLVKQLGKMPLPVEIVPFGYKATLKKIESLGYPTRLRQTKTGQLFVTDSGHYIVDIPFERPIDHPEKVNEELLHIPGVVETGFFFGLAGRIIVGYFDGRIEIRS